MNDITLIQNKIYEIRGQRVMLDFDLAPLYQVQTKVLKQAVRRNIERFPADFMFEITIDEYNSLKDSLRSQIVTSNKGGTRYMPFAFTEQGVSTDGRAVRNPRETGFARTYRRGQRRSDKRPFGRYAQGIGQYLSGNRRPVCQNPAGPQAAPADRI